VGCYSPTWLGWEGDTLSPARDIKTYNVKGQLGLCHNNDVGPTIGRETNQAR